MTFTVFSRKVKVTRRRILLAQSQESVKNTRKKRKRRNIRKRTRIKTSRRNISVKTKIKRRTEIEINMIKKNTKRAKAEMIRHLTILSFVNFTKLTTDTEGKVAALRKRKKVNTETRNLINTNGTIPSTINTQKENTMKSKLKKTLSAKQRHPSRTKVKQLKAKCL